MFNIIDLVFDTYTSTRKNLFNSLNDEYLYHQLLPTTLKKFPDSGSWVEAEKTWELYVNAPKADITFDDETLEVNYTMRTKNGSSTVCKVLSYPENSIPESVNAVKKDDNTIVISVSKAVIDTPKRKKITIE